MAGYKLGLSAGVACLTLIGLGAPALADEAQPVARAPAAAAAAPPPAAPPPSARAGAAAGGVTIGEVVVTAEKREQNINTVAMSVQAASGQTLQKLGITDTEDLQKIVPGFLFTPTYYGTNVFTIRGVGFQDTSLAYVVGLADFMTSASLVADRDGRPVELYVFVALVYFALCSIADLGIRRLRWTPTR